MADRSKKTETHAQITKAQRAEEGKKAMSDYEADIVATRAKTERLRALRLARDAAAPPPAPKKAAAPKKKAAKAAKGASGTLSDWLDDQKKGGHNS
jgi:hypothetical protein